MTALEQRVEELERAVAQQRRLIAELRRETALESLEPMTQVEIRDLAHEIHQQGTRRRRG